MLECGIKQTEDQLGCTPWYLPCSENSTVCDPWTGRTFMEIMRKNADKHVCLGCLPDCEAEKTTMVTSAAKFR